MSVPKTSNETFNHINAGLLKKMLEEAPLMYKSKLHSREEKYILTNCYRALWSDNKDWMQKYYFQEELSDSENLSHLLEKYNIFGSKKPDTSDTKHKNPILDDSDEPEYSESQRGKQCGHAFKPGESIYRCRDCGLDNTCVMCSKCFHGTDHEGHDVKIAIGKGSGGFCDCGDIEAWKIPLRCKIHYLDPSTEKVPSTYMQPFSSVPEPVINSVRETISVVIDYILETLSASFEDMSEIGSIHSIEKDCVDTHKAFGLPIDLESQSYACVLWNDEKHTFDQVISVIKRTTGCTNNKAEFVAHSVDKCGRHIVRESKDIKSLLETANIISTVGLAVSISSMHKITREDIAGLLLEWLKELIGGRYRFFRNIDQGDCIIRDIICEVLSDDWSLHPAFAQLSNQNKRSRVKKNSTRSSTIDATDVENAVISAAEERALNNTGNNDEGPLTEDDILVDIQNIRRIARIIEQTRLNALQWNETPTETEPLNTSQEQKDVLDFEWDWESWIKQNNEFELKENEILEDLGVHRHPSAKNLIKNNDNLKTQLLRKIRLDYLLHFNLRLWKSARTNVKDLLIGTFISNLHYKPVLGSRFVRNYPELVDTYYFKDREPENSIINLSVQVLTVPTVAYQLVKEYKFFDIVCTILSNFFLSDRIQISLPDGYSQAQIQLNSQSIKRQRYAFTIHDLHYLMMIDGVKLDITKNPSYIGHFINLLFQFQAMDPFKRHFDTHVEYESKSWVSAFNITLQISKLCSEYATCYSITQDHMSVQEASTYLCRDICRILKAINDWNPILPPDATQDKEIIKGTSKQILHTLETPCAGSYDVVEYNITTGPVSFHHPLHWTLSSLLEHVSLLDGDTLKANGWSGGFKEMVNCAFKHSENVTFLNVLEYSIRTLSLISQVSCGVWVRNGYSIRNQVYTYKDINVREYTLDRDIYLLQVGFTICDNNQLLLTLIDRFQLHGWFSGKHKEKKIIYDSTQKLFMVEELLNLLIICATEYGYASGKTIKERIRRAIIQNLGISNLSYSELTKLIPETLTEHNSFNDELKTVANFKAPDGLNDKGIYEIKAEFLDDIDPHFWYYTCNNREEAYNTLKKRWNVLHPENTISNDEEFVVEPKVHEIKKGIFQHMGNFLHSQIFVQILLYSLWNIKTVEGTKGDNILDDALYLGMLAVTDPNNEDATFFKYAIQDKYAIQVNEIEKIHTNLVTVLLKCIEDNTLLNAHKRLKYIVDKIEQANILNSKEIIATWKESRQPNSATNKQNTSDSDDLSEYERKKAAAKSRQSDIMSQFAMAQSKFLEKHAEMYKSDYEMKDVKEETEDVVMNESSDIVRKCHFIADNCIVCQEIMDETRLYGMLCLVQRSNIQRLSPDSKEIWADILEAANNFDDPWGTPIKSGGDKEVLTGFPVTAHISGADISSCGHQMHAKCFEAYQKSVQQDTLIRNLSQRTPESRFLCPLCKAVGNVLIPIVWKGKKETYPGAMAPSTPYEDVYKNLRKLSFMTDFDKELHLNENNKSHNYDQDSNPIIKDKENLQFFYNKFMRIVYKAMGNKMRTNVLDLKDCLLQLYDMYAYTIGNREIAQRGSEDTRTRDLMVEHTGTFVDYVPTTTQTLLKILSLTNILVPKLMDSPWQTEESNIKMAILEKQLNQMVPQVPNDVPLLTDDPFRVFVQIGFSTANQPSFEPHHLMQILYIAELTKTVIGIAQFIVKNESLNLSAICNGQKYTKEADSVHKFVDHVLESIHFHDRHALYNKINPEGFAALLRLFTLPYLRKSLMLMVSHHGFIPQIPTDILTKDSTNEYDNLLEILRLPTFELVFDLNTSEKNFMAGWFTDYCSEPAESPQVLLSLPTKYCLTNLPYRLDYLLDESSKRICRKCNSVPEHSAICLICGTFVCPRQICCEENSMGECNSHMKYCGGDIGIYMMIKECYMLLLHDNGGSIMNAPYLDSHGEADIFFKRGSPQFLNDKRYELLRQMWLTHTIPLFIRRRMEPSHTDADWGSF